MQSQPFYPGQQMQKDTYEIFHCREEKDPAVELHHHDFYEVYLLLDGDVGYWVDGINYRMTPGDILLIHPQELHKPILHPSGGCYERIVLWIRREYLLAVSDDNIDLTRCFDTSIPGHRRLICAADAQKHAITARLGELAREYHSDAMGSALLANGLFLQFMVELNRLASNHPVPETDGEGVSLVPRVLAYIGAHCQEELTLDSIADYFFVSKYHLSHAFSREVGIPVYRYITIRRLMLAKQLLMRGIPAGEVCYRTGFGDYAGFYRAFKTEYGMSPREAAAVSRPGSGSAGG